MSYHNNTIHFHGMKLREGKIQTSQFIAFYCPLILFSLNMEDNDYQGLSKKGFCKHSISTNGSKSLIGLYLLPFLRFLPFISFKASNPFRYIHSSTISFLDR